MDNCLKITSLNVRYPFREGGYKEDLVPFSIVNLTFKIDQNHVDGSPLWRYAEKKSQDYDKELTFEDPEKVDQWYLDCALSGDFFSDCPYYQSRFVHRDRSWTYLPKFDTFWFRDWIAYSPVTEAILDELRSYKEDGSMKSTYRTINEGIILSHIETLGVYSD